MAAFGVCALHKKHIAAPSVDGFLWRLMLPRVSCVVGRIGSRLVATGEQKPGFRASDLATSNDLGQRETTVGLAE